MHMHADAEPNEKMRLREATAIIMAGGVTNGILGVVKNRPRRRYRVPATDCFRGPLAVGHCIRCHRLGRRADGIAR